MTSPSSIYGRNKQNWAILLKFRWARYIYTSVGQQPGGHVWIVNVPIISNIKYQLSNVLNKSRPSISHTKRKQNNSALNWFTCLNSLMIRPTRSLTLPRGTRSLTFTLLSFFLSLSLSGAPSLLAPTTPRPAHATQIKISSHNFLTSQTEPKF